jgi:hypothetical protein
MTCCAQYDLIAPRPRSSSATKWQSAMLDAGKHENGQHRDQQQTHTQGAQHYASCPVSV